MRVVASLLVLVVSPGVFASTSERRTLSFEQRVSAQAAIERVYYSHQVDGTRAFEDAVPRAVLETKVRKYLNETEALATFWNTPVTDEMLQRELERMAQGTKIPERLLELYAALGDDPFLVKECLARPALVDRMTRQFYGFDPAMHAGERARAERLHARLALGSLNPLSDDSDRKVIEMVTDSGAAGAPPAGPGQPVSLRLSATEFRERRAELPATVGQVSPLRETRDAFTIVVVLSETTTSARVAQYLVPKTSWDVWWDDASGPLHPESVPTVSSERGTLPPPAQRASNSTLSVATGAACSSEDFWDNGALAEGTRPATNRAAVWTGSLMVVWGGFDGSGTAFTNGGGRYDPATDTWTPTSTAGAPPPRQDATAVWTGSRMIVWGGFLYENTGGRYDPVSDTWLSTSMTGVPSARTGHTAVWTGSAMIVWGGRDGGGVALATGGRYDPATDTWTPTSLTNAPAGRSKHAAVWSGSSMLVWGGTAASAMNSGARYDPATNTWTAMSTVGAPSARSQHTAVWSGSAMLVWGGYDGSADLNTGGRYNPVADAWSPIAISGAPTSRSGHTAIWTGSRMIVWGGTIPFNFRNTGGRYDPATDTWTATSTAGAPAARANHSVVWTGSLMIVVAGQNNGVRLDTGGRYDPMTDSWTPTALFGDPPAVSQQTAVWTGSFMVVWGGSDNFTPYLNSGRRYDPATDSWTPTTTTGAPAARFGHTAVWTGDLMIIWGGGPAAAVVGGRYDPLTDSWSPTSTIGAPFLRNGHSAVWTGSSMIIWGGADTSSGNSSATGGRYDPTTDTWAPTSTAGAPFPRVDHTAVWTGSQMIVWGGGFSGNPPYVNSGGRYTPATDSWTPTSTANAPTGRRSHSVVWTGNRMIVWGGTTDASGGLYDPSSDSWTPTSTTGAPVARHEHTAVWTGTEMVNWGGFTSDGRALNSGGRYDPATDSWIATSTVGAPFANMHVSVWTGNMMIVWNGNVGGRYFIGSGCEDGNVCTDDTCDQILGCVHTNNTSPCDDGNACTVSDTCSDGVCLGGAERSCDDGNACTADSCDSASGCEHTPISCDDGNACTVDSCSPTSGCVNTPISCDDGNACNGVESCDPSTGCIAGSPVVCAAPDPCHQAGACQPTSGSCTYANLPDGTLCDDGNSGTNDDVCTGGVCAGSPCDTHPTPKPSGHYKSLCRNGQGHPSGGDALTDADAQCVGRLTTTFAGISTVPEICSVFGHDDDASQDGGGPDSKSCTNADAELMSLALNICRGNVCESQEVDSGCSGHDGPDDHSLTTVGASLTTADAILSDPNRSSDACKDARCLAREINNGKGIHQLSLAIDQEPAPANGLRLRWDNPVMDDGSGQGVSYTIWRRPLRADAPFTQLAQTSNLTYVDESAATGSWEYQITFTIEP